MRLPYGSDSGMAAVSCLLLLQLSSLLASRSANYATATYYIPSTPILGFRGMPRITDRSIDRSCIASNSVARFRGAIEATIPLEIFHPTDPLACLLLRVRVTTTMYKKRRRNERAGTLKFMRLLCDRIGCRRYTDCLVALPRGLEQWVS